MAYGKTWNTCTHAPTAPDAAYARNATTAANAGTDDALHAMYADAFA
ncbi:MAG: hypothetical protein WB502_03100 [Thermoactinomyces sp.]